MAFLYLPFILLLLFVYPATGQSQTAAINTGEATMLNKVYRIGGDEFTIIATADNETSINAAIANIEKQLRESEY